MQNHGHAPTARILRRVREDATDLALLVTSTPADNWKFVNETNNCCLYELTGESLPHCISTVDTFGAGGGGHPSEFYMVRAVTTMDADVDELLSFFKTTHTQMYQEVMKKLFGKLVENGVTLDKLTCTTPPAIAQDSDGDWQSYTEDDAYAANWLTLRSLNKLGGVESCHDFTMMCYQDIFERNPDKTVERLGMRQGRRAVHDVTPHSLIGVHTFSSMNFSDIPELPKSSKTERLHFRNSGLVVETTNEPSTVRVSFLLSLMPNKNILKTVAASPRIRVAQSHGSSLAKKYVKWLQGLAVCLGNLAEAEKPGVTIERLTKMEWVESDHCFVCLKSFGTLIMRRCHHCRFCGEAVCSSCSGFIDMSAFDVSYIEREGDVKHRREEAAETRGCVTCIAELQMNLSPTTHKREHF
ncbi:1-phosphatidylinositol 3-phosphate 5-kinase FAB1 [Phytophthora citrophthora]|uniref:1-phosphatidylinositol 3-phosphate 5-kinase FAB1 n=1 Tax=Phytophthora citrophthora TaxID=4793 RepID=A0AAD9GQI6_9STRA|nr:1-phosphatidylinositol 3-phosphate 5-kinase FAB1 [Phytophthora citrophthora]